jgi:hypothetical protein
MRNLRDYSCSEGSLKKVTFFLVLLIAAIGFAIATTPTFAMRDMKALSTATATAEGVLLAGTAAATGTTAGGTVRSLFSRSGKRITGLGALQALAYSVHKSGTLWLIAAAKFLSAISIVSENAALEPNSWANILAVVVWVAAVGSAVSAVMVLSTRPGESMKAESARVSKSRVVGFIVFLVGMVVAYYLTL